MRVNRYFCFADEATGMAALAAAGLLMQDYETDQETGERTPVGDPYLPPNGKGAGYDLFVRNLPDHSQPTQITVDGVTLTTYPPLAGWHIDIWTALPLDALATHEVYPAIPMFAC